jgi:Helix-turn-helix domain of transposase family ISL3
MPDHERIVELLRDETRSFRSIARELGVSDWTVRRVARELDGDPRPMKRPRGDPPESPDEPLGAMGWLVFAGFIAALVLLIWFIPRWMPPPES